MKDIIALLRPHQYIKNLFIFAPLLFSFSFDESAIVNSIIAFVFFSLIASSIYVLNDFMDIKEDQQHPKKKFRPLASGKVSKSSAKVLVVVLASISLLGSFFVSQALFMVLFIYFVLNIAYSLKLKHVSIVDIFIIATGFVLRLFAGSSVVEAELSMWIIVITFLLALFLAIAKRRDDVLLSLEGKETRKNIDGYNLEFVNATMILMAGSIIVSYILYTISPEVVERLNCKYLYLTSFFVILGVIRYMQITFVDQNSGSPTKIVLSDKVLQLTIVFWLISFLVVVKL